MSDDNIIEEAKAEDLAKIDSMFALPPMRSARRRLQQQRQERVTTKRIDRPPCSACTFGLAFKKFSAEEPLDQSQSGFFFLCRDCLDRLHDKGKISVTFMTRGCKPRKMVVLAKEEVVEEE